MSPPTSPTFPRVGKPVKGDRALIRLPLQWKLMALVMIVILISWVVAGVFMARGLSDQVDALQGERVMGVGRLVASRSDVRDAFQLEHPESVLQPLVEQLLEESSVGLIVILDMQGIRYAHPNPDLVGLPFTGGDEGPALRGEEYVSHARGISGPSLRAFVPLRDQGGEQIGVVVAGVWTQNVENQARGLLADLAAFSLVGLVAGAFGAAAVAYNIKSSIFGLEPTQIGTMLEERLAIIQGVREGVMAVDRESRITLLNREAERLLGIGEDVIGLPVSSVVPNSRLPEVVASGEPTFDQEQTVGSSVILTNRVPIVLRGRVVGAVATFRDLSEIRELAAEVTGARQLAEALRAQAHEFVNRLHTVSGLLQLGKHQDALDYIANATQAQQEMVGFVTRRVHDPVLGGLLLGKISAARERGILLELDPDSYVPAKDRWLGRVDRVLIVGNLVENSLDAVSSLEESRRHVWVSIYLDEVEMLVEVEDTGVGIPTEDHQRILERGFSTKPGSKGLGLSLVAQEVARLGGTLELESQEGVGSRFVVRLPREGRGRASRGEAAV